MSEAKAAPVIKEEPRMSTKKEQAGHALGVLGHDSAYTLWATWMTPFLTDVAMIPAAVLGALLAIGRVWDGFNDILMGSLVDRTRSPSMDYACGSAVLRCNGSKFCRAREQHDC